MTRTVLAMEKARSDVSLASTYDEEAEEADLGVFFDILLEDDQYIAIHRSRQAEKRHRLERRTSIKRFQLLAAGIAFSTLAATVVVLVMVLNESNTATTSFDQPGNNHSSNWSGGFNNESSISSEMRFAILSQKLQSISHIEILLDESSFQYQALSWMAYDDPANLNLSNVTDQTIIERYILALFYFATHGHRWTNDVGFLSEKSICDWASGSNGVFCGNDSNVEKLVLGEFSIAPCFLAPLMFH